MARGRGQIGLNIAQRTKPNKASFDYRAANVEQWVQELPVGNTGETARRVYETLYQVNRLDIPWRDRHRFLEQLRKPVHYVQSSLLRRFTGLPFPLPEKAQRISLLARTLYDEMALGYKTAIEDMLSQSFLTRDNKMLTQLLHRAVRYLSQSILTCYQTYTPHPEDSWFELHALYLHAENKQLFQDPVRDEYNLEMPESSIARAYKQILLLALTSPYRLRQGEAEALYLALARWAGHAHIIPYNSPSAGDALFVVHLDSDQPPDYQAFNHRHCDTELCRLVDTRQLSQVLEQETEQRMKGNRSGPISSELMRRLIRTWGVAPKRHFSRNESHSSLDVVVGFTNLHKALSQEAGDPRLQSKTASYASKEVIGIDAAGRDDIWDIYSSQKMKSSYEHYRALTEMETPAEPSSGHNPVTESWQIRNESAGGYRLALDPQRHAKVQVGELIGMHHSGAEASWEVGVVRWMRQSTEGELEIGIQALAPKAHPVMVKNKQGGGLAAAYQYGLLLPEIPAIKQAASLITPIRLFQPGNELSLQSPGSDLKLTLTHQIQDTGIFVQYLFTSKQQPLHPSASDESDTDAERLQAVWKEL